MKDPRAASFSPMFHWTEHNIRVHTFTCVLALQLAHLMRRRAARAGLRMSVRAQLAELAGIGETVLLYPGEQGQPGPPHAPPRDTSPRSRSRRTFSYRSLRVMPLPLPAPRRPGAAYGNTQAHTPHQETFLYQPHPAKINGSSALSYYYGPAPRDDRFQESQTLVPPSGLPPGDDLIRVLSYVSACRSLPSE